MPVTTRRVGELLTGFLAGRALNTVVAYEQDLNAFAVFFSAATSAIVKTLW